MSTKQIALAIIPKITGSISFICSTYLVQHILRDSKKRRVTYHRLICGMSIGDCFSSFFGFVLSTWPLPKETGIWGASGNVVTCDIAGFFNHAGNLIVPFYNASLATFYLWLLKYSWTDTQIRNKEIYLHSVPWIIGGGIAVATLILGAYGPANWICWIAPYPSNCDSQETCIRGWNYEIYRWALHYAEVWLAMIYVTIVMLMVYYGVVQLEHKILRYRFQGDEATKKHNKSRRVMKEAFMYVGAFFLTWIFGTITRMIQAINGKTYYGTVLCMTIFFPMQGLFNYLIYKRPIQAYKRRRKNKQKQKRSDDNDANNVGDDPSNRRQRSCSPRLTNCLGRMVGSNTKDGMKGDHVNVATVNLDSHEERNHNKQFNGIADDRPDTKLSPLEVNGNAMNNNDSAVKKEPRVAYSTTSRESEYMLTQDLYEHFNPGVSILETNNNNTYYGGANKIDRIKHERFVENHQSLVSSNGEDASRGIENSIQYFHPPSGYGSSHEMAALDRARSSCFYGEEHIDSSRLSLQIPGGSSSLNESSNTNGSHVHDSLSSSRKSAQLSSEELIQSSSHLPSRRTLIGTTVDSFGNVVPAPTNLVASRSMSDPMHSKEQRTSLSSASASTSSTNTVALSRPSTQVSGGRKTSSTLADIGEEE